MSQLAPLLFSVALAVAELMIGATFEVRVAVGSGRPLRSRLLSWVARKVYRPVSAPRMDAARWAVILAIFQLFPLSRERVFGGSQPPDHVSGAAVIVAEVIVGTWLWLATRPAQARATKPE